MYNPFEILNEKLERIEKALSQPATAPETILSKTACKDFLGVSMNTLDSYVKQGLIPCYGMGSKIFFKRTEVLASLTKIN